MSMITRFTYMQSLRSFSKKSQVVVRCGFARSASLPTHSSHGTSDGCVAQTWPYPRYVVVRRSYNAMLVNILLCSSARWMVVAASSARSSDIDGQLPMWPLGFLVRRLTSRQ